MPSSGRSPDRGGLRRWVGGVVCLAVVGILGFAVPRLGPHSPLVILLVCAVAVVTVKLVESRVQQWFRRWAGPKGRS